MRYYHLTPEDQAIVGRSISSQDMADHDRDDLSIMRDLDGLAELWDPCTRIEILESEINDHLLAGGHLPVGSGFLEMGSCPDHDKRTSFLIEEIKL